MLEDGEDCDNTGYLGAPCFGTCTCRYSGITYAPTGQNFCDLYDNTAEARLTCLTLSPFPLTNRFFPQFVVDALNSDQTNLNDGSQSLLRDVRDAEGFITYVLLLESNGTKVSGDTILLGNNFPTPAQV